LWGVVFHCLHAFFHFCVICHAKVVNITTCVVFGKRLQSKEDKLEEI
jgi:hypothetical protein